MIDYIFVSHDLIHLVKNVRISTYPDNMSDHLPIEMDLDLNLKNCIAVESTVSNSNVIWSKLSNEQLLDFASTMELGLDMIEIPDCLVHGTHLCFDNDHINAIENYHEKIVGAVRMADATLQRHVFRALKPFWSRTLSELKRRALETFKIWSVKGRPNSGGEYDDYFKSRQEYRSTLGAEKKKCRESNNDALFTNLVSKDSPKFWKLWKNIADTSDPLSARIDGFTNDSDIAKNFANVF